MEQVFVTVLNMSGTGAIVICAILLLRLALRRAPKKYSLWLWAAAGFRLLCPVSFRSVFSLFSLAPAHSLAVEPVSSAAAAPVGSIAYVPADIGYMAQPKLNLPLPQLSEAFNQVLPAADPVSSINPMQVWLFAGSLVWLLGFAVLLVWGLVSYLRLARRLRTAVRLEGEVFQTEAVGVPFLLGFFRPRIYIPYGLEGERLDSVLAHERFHLRRRDHLVKLLAFALLCVHWFNPLVWLAFCLMGRDMEMRCDEAVLGREAVRKQTYSETLLSFALGGRFPSPGPLAFGETGVKARIRNALRWKRPRRWVTVLAGVLVIAGVAACAANPAEPAEPPAEGTEATVSPAEKTGSPWDWTHTVRPEGISGSCSALTDGQELRWTLSEAQVAALCQRLNRVPQDAVYPGRGYPRSRWVRLTDGTRFWDLCYGGDCAVLAFDDETAKLWEVDPLYGPAPSWEIHDRDLLEYLEGLEPEAPPDSGLFSEELREQIIEDHRHDEPWRDSRPGSVHRYFDTWAEACAWANWSPDNPLEDLDWLQKKNTAGTDVSLNGGLEHAMAAALGDEAGNPLSLSLSAGYASREEDVRVQFTAQYGVIMTQDWDGRNRVLDGCPAVVSADEGERFSARELRYDRDGAGCSVRLISTSKDAAALDAAWARLMELYAFRQEDLAAISDIVIPDRGQGPEAAAAEWCEQATAPNPNSRFRNLFTKANLSSDEGWNARYAEQGYEKGQQWRFVLELIFVPENEQARRYQMAGNTQEYTGSDPEVPEGAYICYRVGYLVLEDDGWHGEIVGTGW